MWQNMWDKWEDTLRLRFAKNVEKLEVSGHPLAKLEVGDHVRIQNRGRSYPKKWDKTGVVVEVWPHDQYSVKVDGSRRLTPRNRKFLRKFKLYNAEKVQEPRLPAAKERENRHQEPGLPVSKESEP